MFALVPIPFFLPRQNPFLNDSDLFICYRNKFSNDCDLFICFHEKFSNDRDLFICFFDFLPAEGVFPAGTLEAKNQKTDISLTPWFVTHNNDAFYMPSYFGIS